MNAKTFQAAFYAARLLHPEVKVTARIPMAQSALEAGSTWNSNLALTANNLFGMKKPVLRKTTAIGETAKGFAVFSSQLSSINDYILFLSQLGLTTNEKLLAYIKEGKYTKDAGYLSKLNQIMDQQTPTLLNPIQMGAYATAGAIALALGVKLVNKFV